MAIPMIFTIYKKGKRHSEVIGAPSAAEVLGCSVTHVHQLTRNGAEFNGYTVKKRDSEAKALKAEQREYILSLEGLTITEQTKKFKQKFGGESSKIRKLIYFTRSAYGVTDKKTKKKELSEDKIKSLKEKLREKDVWSKKEDKRPRKHMFTMCGYTFYWIINEKTKKRVF